MSLRPGTQSLDRGTTSVVTGPVLVTQHILSSLSLNIS